MKKAAFYLFMPVAATLVIAGGAHASTSQLGGDGLQAIDPSQARTETATSGSVPPPSPNPLGKVNGAPISGNRHPPTLPANKQYGAQPNYGAPGAPPYGAPPQGYGYQPYGAPQNAPPGYQPQGYGYPPQQGGYQPTFPPGYVMGPNGYPVPSGNAPPAYSPPAQQQGYQPAYPPAQFAPGQQGYPVQQQQPYSGQYPPAQGYAPPPQGYPPQYGAPPGYQQPAPQYQGGYQQPPAYSASPPGYGQPARPSYPPRQPLQTATAPGRYPPESLIPEFGKSLPAVPRNPGAPVNPANWGTNIPQQPTMPMRPMQPSMPMQPAMSPEEEKVTKLEQIAFGSTYPEHEVDDRVDHLEKEVFGSKTDGPMSDRLAKLEAKLGGGGAFGQTPAHGSRTQLDRSL